MSEFGGRSSVSGIIIIGHAYPTLFISLLTPEHWLMCVTVWPKQQQL
jgi:hypothetical protein